MGSFGRAGAGSLACSMAPRPCRRADKATQDVDPSDRWADTRQAELMLQRARVRSFFFSTGIGVSDKLSGSERSRSSWILPTLKPAASRGRLFPGVYQNLGGLLSVLSNAMNGGRNPVKPHTHPFLWIQESNRPSHHTPGRAIVKTEAEGFEPPLPFQVRRFSKPLPSAARPRFLSSRFAHEMYQTQANRSK